MFHVPGFTRRVEQSVLYQKLQYRGAGHADATSGNILFDLRCLKASQQNGE